jgi:hypothetical protein
VGVTVSGVITIEIAGPFPLPLHLETGDRFIKATSLLQIIDEHTQRLERIIAGSPYLTCSTS